MGLSPRVRGNPALIGRDVTAPGSIPARAGEPLACRRRTSRRRVYPRACGGTPEKRLVAVAYPGLSPRVRGNQSDVFPRTGRYGSIPARAGELETTLAVYPRACGGTAQCRRCSEELPGLSPRVRGNLGDVADTEPPAGSIPARAGEPRSAIIAQWAVRVYPRACGGTEASIPVMNIAGGLSPRVRGNQRYIGVQPVMLGSIPARAGEPQDCPLPPTPGWVYPRACGGTKAGGSAQCPLAGLSPRVRGNLPGRAATPIGTRSIPARAGEPAPTARRS